MGEPREVDDWAIYKGATTGRAIATRSGIHLWLADGELMVTGAFENLLHESIPLSVIAALQELES